MSGDSNGYDTAELQSVVKRIEGYFDDLLSLQGTYRADCRPFRKKIKEAYADAKAAGIDPDALKAEIKIRELHRKAAETVAGLEADQRETYEMIHEALGDFADTPLGEATLARARPAGETLDSLAEH
jgi:uncharacterized protein (UPF0335 family)